MLRSVPTKWEARTYPHVIEGCDGRSASPESPASASSHDAPVGRREHAPMDLVIDAYETADPAVDDAVIFGEAAPAAPEVDAA